MPSVVISLVVALRSAARSRAALHFEILALRHRVAVLNRSRSPRLRLTAADRLPEDHAPQYLLHDRDSVFTDVASTMGAMQIHEVVTAPRSPWAAASPRAICCA